MGFAKALSYSHQLMHIDKTQRTLTMKTPKFDEIVRKNTLQEYLRAIAGVPSADNLVKEVSSSGNLMSADRISTLNLSLIKELHHWGASEEKVCHAMQLTMAEYHSVARMIGINLQH
jgi:hypothetical protein